METKKKGLAIKLQTSQDKRTHENIRAKDVIRLHQDVLNSKQYAYFSCNFPVNIKEVDNIDYLLLYVPGDPDNAHLAKVVSIKSAGKNENFIPADSKEYSPREFADEANRTWFLLSEIRQASENELKSLHDRKDGKSAWDKMLEKARFNRFYFE